MKHENERKILVALFHMNRLNNPDIIQTMALLKAEYFEAYLHKKMFQYLMDVTQSGQMPSLSAFMANNQGVVDDLEMGTILLEDTPARSALPAYAKQLAKEYYAELKLKKIQKATELLAKAHTLDEQQQITDDLAFDLTTMHSSSSSICQASGLSNSVVESMESGEAEKIPTGDPVLDYHLDGGLGKEEIVVLGGQSGTGKTTYAAKLINLLSIENNHKSVMFSLEMTKAKFGMMLLGQTLRQKRSELTPTAFSNDSDHFARGLSKMSASESLWFYGKKTLTIEEIELSCRYLNAKEGLDFVFIDFLTAVKTQKNIPSIFDRVNHVMDKITKIAEENKCTVIVIAQLNRDVKNSADGKPDIIHLKGSSDIENFSDLVLFAYRESFTNKDCGHDYLEILIRKSRYGEKTDMYYETLGGTIFDTKQETAALLVGKPNKDKSSMAKMAGKWNFEYD